MKIILKNIVGVEQEREVTPDTSIKTIKKSLEEEYILENLRLCYNGAIVDDKKTIAELGMQENGVLLVAGKKIKHQKTDPKPATTVPPPEAKAQAPAESSSVVSGKEGPLTEAPPTAAGATAPASHPAVSAPGVASQGVDPALIDMIVAMGFEDREQVALALRAAYMNPDRAVEFLCTSIPPSVMQHMSESAPAPFAAPETAPASTNRLTSHIEQGSGGSALRNALMQIPQFEQIRSIVEANPESLPTVIQQLRIHHPEVIQLIQQDPNEFLQIMGHHGQTDLRNTSDGQGVQDPYAAASPPVVSIQITEAERVVVERLVELGGGAWTAVDAIEAYRACEESEEAAAHFLFSNFMD